MYYAGPLPGNEIQIHNPDKHGVGEIWVRGNMVMPGYLENDDDSLEIYNLSLDELIYGEKENDKEKEEPKVNENAEDQPYVNVDTDENRVKIGPTNIIVEDK